MSFLSLDLGEWSELAVVAQTGLVAAGTWYVASQLRQARKVQDETARPYIVVDLENRGQRVDLVIRNVGHTSAVDVRVLFEPVPTASSDRLAEVIAMLRDDGLSYLAPGKEIRFWYGLGHTLLKGEHTTRFSVSASYAPADRAGDPAKRIVDPTYTINFERLRHMLTQTPAEDKVVEQLKKMAGDLGRAANELGTIADSAATDNTQASTPEERT